MIHNRKQVITNYGSIKPILSNNRLNHDVEWHAENSNMTEFFGTCQPAWNEQANVSVSILSATALSLSQKTNFRLFLAERVCRRKFWIWWKWQKGRLKHRKHCGKRKNCSWPAISPSPTVYSKDLNCRYVKPGLKPHFSFSRHSSNLFFAPYCLWLMPQTISFCHETNSKPDDYFRQVHIDGWQIDLSTLGIISMGECNTILSAYTLYRHLG